MIISQHEALYHSSLLSISLYFSICFLDLLDMGEAVEIMFGNGFPEIHKDTSPIQTLLSNQQDCHWYEETIDDDLKWSFALNSVLHTGTSEYQEIALLDTKHFGKVHFRLLV